MIDKVELGAPQWAQFRTPIAEAMRVIDWQRGSVLVSRSRHYTGVLDLRPYGSDALLHAYYRYREAGGHKLELLDTGKKTLSQLIAQIRNVFDLDPASLRVMRVDLCADVHEVPVSWFHPRIQIKFKRFGHEIGETKYGQMGSRKIETLVMGKRPNLFRIYDKTAECMVDFRKRFRNVSPDADALDFTKEYGFSPDTVLTRIERQIGGGKVPMELSTFGELARNASDFNPFVPLQFIAGQDYRVPTLEECALSTWCIGTQLRRFAHEWGMQQLRAMLNRKSKGNAARILAKYERFLFHDVEHELTVEMIREIYRKSVTAQLNG